jgi:Tfp pilus assembly protein PilO
MVWKDTEDEFPSWTEAWKHGPRLMIFILAMVAILSVGSVWLYKLVAPMRAEAEREVYEETKSYVDGTIRDLQNLRLEYLSAETEAHKSALRSTILHRAADFDRAKLPENLRDFIAELEAIREEQS